MKNELVKFGRLGTSYRSWCPRSTLSAMAFLLMAGTSLHADSGTWNLLPADGNWNNSANWNDATIPNGTGQIATFGLSDQTNVSLSAATEVGSIVFSPTASAYTLTAPGYILTVSGSGISNNSGSAETLVTQSATVNGTATRGRIYFENNATAGTGITIENKGGATVQSETLFYNTSSGGNAAIQDFGGTSGNDQGTTGFTDSSTAGNAIITNVAPSGAANVNAYPGILEFESSATAGQASIINNGGTIANGFYGGQTQFSGSAKAGTATLTDNGSSAAPSSSNENEGASYFMATSSADHATIINNASLTASGLGGEAIFENNSTAGNATVTNNGAAFNSGMGGSTEFQDASTAGNATVIANGGSNGGGGGTIYFEESSTGGTSHIEVEGNGFLDISDDAEGSVTIGSLKGSGAVLLGSDTLSVGSDNGSTTFSGSMQDGGFAQGTGGSLTKTGSGKVILSGANTYTGATTITAGTLQVDGSITSNPDIGTGAKLQGVGSVAAITLESGGFLAPGDTSGTLSASSLTWNGGGIMQFTLGANPDVLALQNGAFDKGTTGTFAFQLNDGGVTVGKTYNLITEIGLTNFALSDVSYDSGGAFQGNFGALYQNGALNLDFTVTSIVPEPTTWTLIGLGLLLMGIGRRSVRRSELSQIS
jgi:autotransporter-associated beta strand protein